MGSEGMWLLSNLDSHSLLNSGVTWAVQVFAIDEAQFFPDLLEFCQTVADHEQKKVIVAGLDGDFRRQRFGQVGNKNINSNCNFDFLTLYARWLVARYPPIKICHEPPASTYFLVVL